MRVILHAYLDRSFKFIVKPPPTSYFLKKACGLQKGSDKPGHNVAGRIGMKYIYEIAKIKQQTDSHMKEEDLEGICKMIMGSVKSMGLEVVEDTIAPVPTKIDV